MYRRLKGLKGKEFRWALKLFASCIGLTFGLWLILLVFSTLIFHSPKPLASITVDVLSLVVERVITLENRVGLWMAIFILNTVVVIVASTFSAFLLLTLSLEIHDLKYRMRHPRYNIIAKVMDKLGSVLIWKPLFLIFKKLDSSFKKIHYSHPLNDSTQGIWRFCGYSNREFRNIFYIFPYMVPAITAIVNGIVIGMLLAVHIFMGAYNGLLIAGLPGLTAGMFINFISFLCYTMPHGILELYAFLTAIALGRRFALHYSNEIFERRLLLNHRLEELTKDVQYLTNMIKQFLKSRTVLISLAFIISLLFIAAYIETYITANIAENVLTFLIDTLF
ncbi:MAG: stage II sporulation protein M [Candidatus Bathyarchaeota archaeon]|nr:MAG: stage II sporulation protein M [Candidatus Bathyarchaeota archaeon]